MTGPSPAQAYFREEHSSANAHATCAARFISGLSNTQTSTLISNCHSRMQLLEYEGLSLPVSIEDGLLGSSYIAAAHSAYVLYARDEIDILGLTGMAKIGGKAVLGVLDLWLQSLAINKSVHIDNWLLSTSLHGAWDGTGLSAIRNTVMQTYPEHLPIIRCVEEWSCPDLFIALEKDGWSFLPSRQIWVTDDLKSNWKPRSHTKSDQRAMRRSGLVIEDLKSMSNMDAQRIADLYAQLYLDRYSSLNPAYNAAFVQLAFNSGAMQWRVARNATGQIMASAGMRVAGNVVTVPMLGYDMARPKSEALYRIASFLSSEWAMDNGMRHHGSSGAGTFKSNRGARSMIEYMAIYTKHLPPWRRHGLNILARILKNTMEPALKSQGW